MLISICVLNKSLLQKSHYLVWVVQGSNFLAHDLEVAHNAERRYTSTTGPAVSGARRVHALSYNSPLF